MPLLTEAAVTGQPVDLQAANAAAAAWSAEVNPAVHSEICTVPNEPVALETNLSDDCAANRRRRLWPTQRWGRLRSSISDFRGDGNGRN
jgi:hypothetical protein